MQYLITFLEGVISFLSPCMLPMLPVYLSYFAGMGKNRRSPLPLAICFVLGFSVIFCAMGVFAGTVGAFFAQHRRAVEVICGAIVILFGLSYLEILPLPFLRGMQGEHPVDGAASAFVFGVIYSLSLTPCIGVFLGSALMMASASGSVGKGLLLLLAYSAGLGIPFLLSAVLIGRLEGAFRWVKTHYRIINRVCGGFLIVVGLCMMAGWMNRLLSLLS